MRSLALLLIGLAASTVRDGLGQALKSTADVRLVEVRVEPEQPSFGEAFDVHVTLRLRPAAVAFLPDTLVPTDAVESVGPGVWSEVPAPGDSVEIRATYRVIGFREGWAELPSLELGIRPAPAAEAEREGGIDDAAGAVAGSAGGIERRVIHLGAVEVAPYLPMADPGAGDGAPEFAPRPPADVLGGEWSLWQLLAVGIASIVAIAVAGVVIIPRWWAAGGATMVARLLGRTPRQRALRELDRILSLGWHRDGRMADFYASSTGTLRRFAERIDPAWGAALTTSELLARLQERWGPDGFQPLASTVAVAERVKFGAYRPSADAAERDWGMIGDWIRGAPED